MASQRIRRGNFLEIAGPGMCWAMRRSADTFLVETARFEAASSQTLERILALNGRTEYGRRCGLGGRAPRRAFEELPLTTYADYVPYIERIAAGEQGLLSGEPVVYFSTTSGTSGPPKMIPVTRQQMRMAVSTRLLSLGLALRAGVLNTMHGRFMTIMTEHVGGNTAGGLPKGAATTGGFRQLGHFSDLILSSPADVARTHDQATARYLHLLFGLREERLWTIVAFFPATILFALRDLEARAPQLLRDLADGTLDPGLELPADARARLSRNLRPERARARALTRLFERGRFTVRDIWPDLGAILTATGGGFHFYVDQLQPFLGEVPIFSPVYGASEGTIGLGFSAREPYYLLLPSLAYIELLPVEHMDDPHPRPIPAWQAKAGSQYEVIITTRAGFTRYRLHDIVRVVELLGQNPVVEFIERRGQVIDIIGEKTAEHHIAAAMESACHAVTAPLVDYFVSPDTQQSPAHYVLAIEGWNGGCDNAQMVRGLLEAFEAALRKTAPDYDEERELGTLGPMSVLLLKPGAFEREREQRVAAGGAASQIKTPHVVTDPGFVHRRFEHEVLSRVDMNAH